jgi:hypothetical protein
MEKLPESEIAFAAPLSDESAVADECAPEKAFETPRV